MVRSRPLPADTGSDLLLQKQHLLTRKNWSFDQPLKDGLSKLRPRKPSRPRGQKGQEVSKLGSLSMPASFLSLKGMTVRMEYC